LPLRLLNAQVLSQILYSGLKHRSMKTHKQMMSPLL